LNSYELFVLIDSALGEEKIDGILSKIEKKIKELGGEIQKVDRWGNRKLASEIKKAKNVKYAYYVLIYFKAESLVPADLLKYLKFTENILRYSLIRAQEKSLEEIEGIPVEETKEAGAQKSAEKSDVFAVGAGEGSGES
jgi:small subunit ribosomal protein S6